MTKQPSLRLVCSVLACSVLALLLCSGAAHTANWNLNVLMGELARRSSGQAYFTETKYLAVLDKPIEQSGTLAFAPGRLEKFTQRPHQERMTVICLLYTSDAADDYFWG